MRLSYVRGGGEWTENDMTAAARNILSSVPGGSRVNQAWFKADSSLQVGGVTYGWLHEALRSCFIVQNPDFIGQVSIPCLFALAGKDYLVDNGASRRMIAAMPKGSILEMKDSLHEIMMERDDIRNAFLEAFYELLESNNIKQKLKPF